MKRRQALLMSIAAVFLLAVAQGAFAHDFWDNWTGKPWHRGEPGSTYQVWEFNQSPGPLPTHSLNPYGIPQLIVQNGQYPDVVPGPGGQPIPTWHLGTTVAGADGTIQETPGLIELLIPNTPEQNPIKLIYVQITSDKYTLDNQNPLVSPGATSISSPGPIIQHGSTSWYTYNWLIEIRPNPPYERLTFVFPYSTNISQVVVDTICTVPEPSSIAMMVASGLFTGVFALRRRRR